MNDNRSFDVLMAQLQAGSDAVATRVFHLYAQRLIAFSRSRLGARIRQKVDPEDIVQSVFRSFFTRQASGEYDLEDWNGLWSLLVRITLNKCINRNKHFRAGIRDVDAEVPAQPAVADSAVGWDFIDRKPTPEEAAILADTLEELMRGLDEKDRKIVEMRLQGYTIEEMHSEVGGAKANVKRTIRRAMDRLDRLLADGGPA